MNIHTSINALVTALRKQQIKVDQNLLELYFPYRAPVGDVLGNKLGKSYKNQAIGSKLIINFSVFLFSKYFNIYIFLNILIFIDNFLCLKKVDVYM